MTDHDPILLASAYLDGDLDAGDRARAEADPVVMAHVDGMRGVIEELRRTEPLGTATRDRLVARALDELTAAGAEPAVAATAAASPRTTRSVPPAPRHRRIPAWLSAAAALVTVAALGTVLVMAGGDSDDDSADTLTSPEAMELESAMDTVADAERESGADEPAEVLAGDATDDAGGSAEAPEDAATPFSTTRADEPGSEVATMATIPTISGADELAALARELLDADEDMGSEDTAPPTPAGGSLPDCATAGNARPLGYATYETATGPRDAVLTLADVDGVDTVSALALNTCEVLATTVVD